MKHLRQSGGEDWQIKIISRAIYKRTAAFRKVLRSDKIAIIFCVTVIKPGEQLSINSIDAHLRSNFKCKTNEKVNVV